MMSARRVFRLTSLLGKDAGYEFREGQVSFGETHLRRILCAYAAYYNNLALQKDAPLHRAVQQSGAIVAIPILAGLHH
jgi:hypothetical protein